MNTLATYFYIYIQIFRSFVYNMLASGEFYGYKRNQDVNKNFHQNLNANMNDQLYLETNTDNTDDFTSVAKQVCFTLNS